MNLLRNIKRTKYKLSCILCLLLLICYTKQELDKHKRSKQMLPIPVFSRCSCDSATYCLTDEDVIQLHVWQENVKFFSRIKKF